MSTAQPGERLQIPKTLRRQLNDFRRRVWTIKTVEAVAAAGFGVVVAFLAMYVLDRFWDTPGLPRFVLFGLAVLGCGVVPLALYRWVWRQRRPDQLARLLARTHPRIGDQLLGVIELARDESEQKRSRQLVGAAIEQVAHDSKDRDFLDAVPTPRHRLWLSLFAAPAALASLLFLFFPNASANAWARVSNPWKNTPRYTFARLEPVPDRLVVPHGEPSHFGVMLAKETASKPGRAQIRVGDRSPVVAAFRDGGYSFEIPAQVAKTRLELTVGDASRFVEIEPMLRPELSAVVTEVTLPDYLARPGAKPQDVRGGSIGLVKGSRARVAATAGRELAAAWVDGSAVVPEGMTITSPLVTVNGTRDLQFRWVDRFGLAGKEPFTLQMVGRDDEPPTMMIEDLPRQKVILDTELIQFKVRAQDDFGVKRVGLEWQGLDKKGVRSVATGERVLAPGGSDKELLDVVGVFSAKSFGIEPQPIALRVFVEDYLPGRPRVVSPPYTLFVLTADQHAIWLTEQLSKWHRQSLEVRDRELQLYEGNKQLRDLSPADLDRAENRKKLEAQAAGEQSNGRRLNGLVANGEELVKQAMRNPEFGVGHLEKWAEMLQVLKDISGNRMPSVAELLKDAAKSPKGLAMAEPGEANKGQDSNPSKDGSPSKDGASKADGDGKSSEKGEPGKPEAPPTSGEAKPSEKSQAGQSGKPGEGKSSSKGQSGKPGSPSENKNSSKGQPGKASESKDTNKSAQAGQMRAQGAPKPTQPRPDEPPKPPSAVPSIKDGESNQQPPSTKEVKPGPASPPKTPRLLLPKTELTGGVKPGDPNAPAPPAQKIEEALTQQRDLLAEFEKVSDELNKVLANLEGSTLVKRLKAASRTQLTVAGKIGEQVGDAFGLGVNRAVAPSAAAFEALLAVEVKGSHNMSVIMDDMAAYFERRRYARFKTVLDEMKQKDVIGSLRQLGDDLKREQGLSIAQCEYWSDTLDRWADDLVDPEKSGVCPGSKAKGSLPPSLVLEVLQILEGEMNLREETRVAEQAKLALKPEEFGKQALGLAKNQGGLKERVEKVIGRIQELPDANTEFAPEMALLGEVATVMDEAIDLLARPETGAPSIAAETDAIELLLKSKRINPKGGGGGSGASPGGGGKGNQADSAMSLVGTGLNEKEVREERSTAQATGDSGPALPEEFRAGLDQYFNKIERVPAGR